MIYRDISRQLSAQRLEFGCRPVVQSRGRLLAEPHAADALDSSSKGA
ncbi:hypothetical protein [Streptomyces thermolilacinus]|nr:hypothetical protein [Streptomyces thermolilacinus]